MVDFGLGQGRSVFATEGVVRLRRGWEKSENLRSGPKDAISGRKLHSQQIVRAIKLVKSMISIVSSSLRKGSSMAQRR
jgi:hypothetical protein